MYSQNKNNASQLKKLLVFEIAAFSRHLQVRKKGGNFKTKKFFNWVASFLSY